MLSRRRATALVKANWWDGGRLEHLPDSVIRSRGSRALALCVDFADFLSWVGRSVRFLLGFSRGFPD